MIWLEIFILAVLQGITEFLPISSSGHVIISLAAFDALGLPIAEKLTVNVVLHIGTLLAIIVFYWQRLVSLLGRDRRVIWLLLIGSIPAAAVGLLVEGTKFGEPIEKAVLENALVAGLMFPVTGLMLLWIDRCKIGDSTCRELSYRGALIIGIFQAFAILPGISRSGATIVAGLACGLRRDEAAAFSFLLAVPAIAGAGLIKTFKLFTQPADSTPLAAMGFGALVSFAVGLAALWLLLRWLRQGRLHYFAYWLIPLGIVVIAWQLLV